MVLVPFQHLLGNNLGLVAGQDMEPEGAAEERAVGSPAVGAEPGLDAAVVGAGPVALVGEEPGCLLQLRAVAPEDAVAAVGAGPVEPEGVPGRYR